MDDYNMKRGAMNFPVDYELGAAVARHYEARRKSVYNACKNYVVKIICFTDDDKQCGFFNGFFYHDTAPYILTCGHIVRFEGATKYKALLFHGTSMEQQLDLQLTKHGQEVKHMQFVPDVAVFTYSCGQPLHPPRPFAATATVGDTVYVAGFKGCDEPQLVFSEGMVSYSGMGGMTITTYADNGFSGCPVFNMDGFIVGMVAGGDGLTIKQVNTVPALTIHGWLISSDPVCPGLKG